MAGARGSATTARATLLLLLCLECEIGFAAKYTVGDARGWDFGVSDWTKGKRFTVGDILEFNYRPGTHDVVVVDRKSYETCKVPAKAKKYNSGHDRIKINGTSFFICGFPGHCEWDMNLAIIVSD